MIGIIFGKVRGLVATPLSDSYSDTPSDGRRHHFKAKTLHDAMCFMALII